MYHDLSIDLYRTLQVNVVAERLESLTLNHPPLATICESL